MIRRNIACQCTKEQKDTIMALFPILHNYSGNWSNKTNLYTSIGKDLGQTSRNPLDYDAKLYFVWVAYEEFKNNLLKILISKKRICMYS